LDKERKHIDDLFKEQLGDLSFPTGDADFSVIQAGLGKKKRRFFFWWILTGVLVFGALGIVGSQFYNSQTKTADLAELSQTPLKSDSNLNSERNIENRESRIQTEEEEHISEQNSEALIQNQDVANQTDNSSNNRSINIRPIENGDKSSQPSFPSSSVEEDFPNDFKPISPVRENNQNDVDENSDDREPRDNEFAKIPSEDINPTEIDSDNEGSEIAVAIPTDTSSRIIEPLKQPITPVRTPWIKYFELHGGYMTSTFDVKSASPDQPEYAKMKQNEEGRPSFEIGAGFGLRKGQWGLSTGLSCQELNFENQAFRFVLYDSFPFLNPTGDTIAWIRKNHRDSILMEPQQTTYQRLSVPLSAHTMWNLNEKIQLQLGLGVITHIPLSQNGNTVSSAGSLQDAATLDLRNWSYQYTLDFGVHYALLRNVNCGLSANYAQGANSIFSARQPMDVRLNNINFKLSVRYELY